MPRVKPEKYNRFLKGLELRSIYLKRGMADFKTESFDVVQKPAMKIRGSSTYRMMKQKKLRIEDNYILTIRRKGQHQTDIKMECCFVLLFDTQEKMTDDVFEIFSTINLPLNTYPYFREFVHSFTSRLGLPSLVLPLRKMVPMKRKKNK